MFFTCTDFDLIISSATMKVDIQMCGILLSLLPKAKERLNSHNFKKSRSMWCSVSSSGLLVSFMFDHYWFVKIPLELSVCSKSGWVKEDVVVVLLEHLVFNFQSCIQNPTLLMMGNYSSQTSFANPDFCKENGFIVASIPPHVSHKCSPWVFLFWVSYICCLN